MASALHRGPRHASGRIHEAGHGRRDFSAGRRGPIPRQRADQLAEAILQLQDSQRKEGAGAELQSSASGRLRQVLNCIGGRHRHQLGPADDQKLAARSAGKGADPQDRQRGVAAVLAVPVRQRFHYGHGRRREVRPRGIFGQFVCNALGIPAIGVGQPRHCCFAARCDFPETEPQVGSVWKVYQGRGWQFSDCGAPCMARSSWPNDQALPHGRSSPQSCISSGWPPCSRRRTRPTPCACCA